MATYLDVYELCRGVCERTFFGVNDTKNVWVNFDKIICVRYVRQVGRLPTLFGIVYIFFAYIMVVCVVTHFAYQARTGHSVPFCRGGDTIAMFGVG